MRLKITILLTFVVLTIVVTYPQVAGFATSVPYHSDPYFSMWRLGWVAHAIRTAPREIFEANIFYPEHDTLGYSDAMLLPGVVLAPLYWMGVEPVLTYNLALFTAFVLSGFTMFLLAHLLTESVPAAILAGVIYAFAPYHFGHYMHLELQIVFWMPFGLLLIHRLLAKGRVRDGLLLGVTVACQTFSSVYLAIFFVTYAMVVVPALLIAGGVSAWRRLVVPVVAGAVLAAVLVAPYARAYVKAEKSVGSRSIEEVRIYSATPSHYLSAPAMNRLYGWTAIRNPIWSDEMNLFPGFAAVALALVGVFAGRGRTRFAYLVGLIFSFDMTRGAYGFIYPWMFEHVPMYRALRSAARIDILVNLSLAVLGAYGAAFLLSRIEQPTRKQLAALAMGLILLAEYASTPELIEAPKPSKVDQILATRPPSVIVELPLASPKNGEYSRDWLFMYQGIPHLHKMLNGYSGYAPASYYAMRDAMVSFPDDSSVAFLRARDVKYIVVRLGLYEPKEQAALSERLQRRTDLGLDVMWSAGPEGAEAIYMLK